MVKHAHFLILATQTILLFIYNFFCSAEAEPLTDLQWGLQQGKSTTILLYWKLHITGFNCWRVYGSQVWSPYKVGEVNSIEHVQKFALCVSAKNWDNSYHELLQLFSLYTGSSATQALPGFVCHIRIVAT